MRGKGKVLASWGGKPIGDHSKPMLKPIFSDTIFVCGTPTMVRKLEGALSVVRECCTPVNKAAFYFKICDESWPAKNDIA